MVKKDTPSSNIYYEEFFSHECQNYLRDAMYELFLVTGNQKNIQTMEQCIQANKLHPILQEMVINTNKNAYERVYVCYKNEKDMENIMGYVWVLVSLDRYGSPQLEVKQWYISNYSRKRLSCIKILKRFIIYIMDMAERCHVQEITGGAFSGDLVDFWKRINGFEATEVIMSFKGSAKDFYRLNPMFVEKKAEVKGEEQNAYTTKER